MTCSKPPLLRGIFLTSEHPGVTAEFYQNVAGLDLEQIGSPETYVYWKLDQEGMQLAIHDAQAFAEYAFPGRSESNVTHLYFKIESQSQFLTRLHELGLTPTATNDVVVTVRDPDGRQVMFGTA
jgi:hypothetical protein